MAVANSNEANGTTHEREPFSADDGSVVRMEDADPMAALVSKDGKEIAPTASRDSEQANSDDTHKPNRKPPEAESKSEMPKKHVSELAANNPIVPINQAATLLMHMYRAEVGRLTTYRTRVDHTTQWALSLLPIFIGFGFTTSDNAVIMSIYPILIAVLLGFCRLEARRYRHFLITHQRARLLETGFYPECLGLEYKKGWVKELAKSLKENKFEVSIFRSFCWRYWLSYSAMCFLVLMAWIVKIQTDEEIDW
eukprot:CAMPEP_0197527154 /NCGR_PEP_ID=MMETSP1318-20131121/20515_1 /TAXON_ID=552666 /ORGANISM="Partenskyella glossopodia, Strain RCC365" /LENGTH=251 /DNA_ID=CAMNT_0043081649 /DNA_START=83 /DNA_END=835 /DNA_ORIENTATION=+